MTRIKDCKTSQLSKDLWKNASCSRKSYPVCKYSTNSICPLQDINDFKSPGSSYASTGARGESNKWTPKFCVGDFGKTKVKRQKMIYKKTGWDLADKTDCCLGLKTDGETCGPEWCPCSGNCDDNIHDYIMTGDNIASSNKTVRDAINTYCERNPAQCEESWISYCGRDDNIGNDACFAYANSLDTDKMTRGNFDTLYSNFCTKEENQDNPHCACWSADPAFAGEPA